MEDNEYKCAICKGIFEFGIWRLVMLKDDIKMLEDLVSIHAIPGRIPDRVIPLFWFSEDEEPDEYNPSESLKD